ncbi:MAG: NUDIX domain-containing protein [Hyphomicrobiales bacterium]
MTAKILRTRIVHQGFAKLLVVTVKDSRGTEFEREIEDRGRAAAVLPYDPIRRTALLVRLLRAPALYAEGLSELLEAPAGMVEDEHPAETIRREALEEVGLRLGALEHVVTAWSSPGLSCERIGLYLAPYSAADRVEQGGGLAVENENITVVEMPLAQLWSLVDRQELTDLKTLALVLALKLRQPRLFE